MNYILKKIAPYVIAYVLSEDNVEMFGDLVDDYVDKAQKRSRSIGKQTRAGLISVLETVMRKLKENDGIN